MGGRVSLHGGFDFPTWENDFPFAGARGEGGGRGATALPWQGAHPVRAATRQTTRKETENDSEVHYDEGSERHRRQPFS